MIAMIVGMVGACVFIIVQLLCLIDFSSNWALSWEAAADGRCGSGWLWKVFQKLLIVFSILDIYNYIQIRRYIANNYIKIYISRYETVESLIGLTSTTLSMVFFLSCYFMYKIFLRRPDGSMCSENGLILCFNGLSSCVLLLTSFFCLAQRSSEGFIDFLWYFSLQTSLQEH